ncbi:FecCD family ABC transporter permease [Paenibacillus tuaregi]|uniref:FecCD family ABC transporter permease n=1 Tax=Paenibacillus tuaregi TaxID=1816681 RepID=UPI0008380789|nr:iron ABC transporter permease [Paenibacillus tuaregi]
MTKGSRGYYTAVLGVMILLLLFGAYFSLTQGSMDMTVKEVITTLLRLDVQPDRDLVIFEFRLPRIVIAVLVGAGLGIAGAVLQGITRNGLADPGILGINAGAGAAMVIFLFFYQGEIKGTGWGAIMAMPMFGLIGGLLSAALIFVFAWKRGSLEPERLLLSGIAVASGLGALTIYFTLKMDAKDFEMAAVWTAGSIYNANWKYIVSMLPWLLILIPVIYSKSRLLDLLGLKDESTRSLGVAADKQRTLLLLCSVGIVSACVSVSGGIGFIGLMSPHIASRLVGRRHSRLLPACGLIGGLLVMISDYIGRTLFSPVELPAGMVVAILGGPYFIYLMYRNRRQA